MAPSARRPTSRDVAHAAGVSQSTVSLVLAGKAHGRVADATADAVRAAAEALGYRPNLAARTLRLGATRTVMLVVPELTSPFFGGVHAGAARAAAERDFAVVAYPTAPPGDVPAPSPFAAATGALDGILASSTVGGELDAVRADGTPAADLPLVMLDSEPGGVPAVNLDVAGGMRDVVAHLSGLGHRRVARLAAAVDSWTFRVRDDAFTDALSSADGMPAGRAAAPLVAGLGPATQAAHGLLADPSARPTAVVCDDDLLAVGVYKAARQLGLRVPQDLSVTGFTDLLTASAVEPELTTVRLPARELGARGMEALLDLLDGLRPADVLLPGELVVRSSTAAPPVPG